MITRCAKGKRGESEAKMCRFLCYMGPKIHLAELLYRPNNSLILQSYRASELSVPLNGDGFGVGWYTGDADCTSPCVFTSLTPAWSNQNLRRLSEHVSTPLFFAHVRAASPGMLVSEANCHPYVSGRYLWMHNGLIRDFVRIKRRLRESLPDHLYNSIEGTTDSEHAFAVFLSFIRDQEQRLTARELGRALVLAIAQLEWWANEAGVMGPSYFNFAVSDGESMAAVRYVSDPVLEPASLYFSAGNKYRCVDGACLFEPSHSSEASVIIASEKLTEKAGDWTRVAPNHVLTVSANLEVEVELMDVVRRSSNGSSIERNTRE
jgi:glutamine amidotransferase